MKIIITVFILLLGFVSYSQDTIRVKFPSVSGVSGIDSLRLRDTSIALRDKIRLDSIALASGGSFIPLSGTTVGNPVTGDIEFDASNFAIGKIFQSKNINGFVNELLFDNDGPNFWLRSWNDTSGVYSSVTLTDGDITLQTSKNSILIETGNDATGRGLTSNLDYTPNITDLDYVQKLYVTRVADSLKAKILLDSLALAGGGGGGGWGLTGNASTVDGTNFIGTTDNVPLSFRVNGEKAGRIDHLLGNTFFGNQSGNANTTGIYNTGNGTGALYSNTTGDFNTAIGVGALQYNTTGSYNTVIGNNTGNGIETGSYNTILGASVTGLAASLSNNIIIADGDGDKRLWIDNTGKVKLPPYGVGTFTGTAAYNLGVTATGDIIEVAGGGITLSQMMDSIQNAIADSSTTIIPISPLFKDGDNLKIKIVSVTDTGVATPAMKTLWDAKLDPSGNGSALTGLTKAQVGLSNVDNTSDASKPISTLQQAGLDTKQATLVSATNIKTINGIPILGAGDIAISGSGGASENSIIKTYQALGSVVKAQTFGMSLQATTSTGSILTDGRTNFIALGYLESAQTLTGVKFYMVTQGNYVADNTNHIGLYSYSGGTLTRVAVTADNGDLWKGVANTLVAEPFTATYAAPAGQYFVGIVWNSSTPTVSPSIKALNSLDNTAMAIFDFTNSAAIQARGTGTSLPTTVAMSTLTPEVVRQWISVY